MSKYDKASLVHIPSGYKSGTLYNVLPNDADGDFDFFRGSTATRVDENGLIETIATGTPRLNYPLLDGVVQDNPTLLLEPSRTNLITYSEDFSQWTASDLTVTDNNSISPDGTLNASKLNLTSITSVKRISLGSMPTSSATRCYSVFFKTNDINSIQLLHSGDVQGYANFDLVNGVLGTSGSKTTSKIEKYGNGWYRCTAIFDNTNAFGSTLFVYIKDNASGTHGGSTSEVGDLFIYGAMYEQGSYPTSYIPTSGSSVTRSADAANGAGTANDFNDSEGVLYANIADFDNDSFRQLTVSNGSNSYAISIMNTTTENQVVCFVNDGITQASISTILHSTHEFNKIAIKYKANDFSVYINGFEIGTHTNGTVPTGLNTLNFDNGAGTDDVYGNTKEVIVFNEALSDTELEALTSYDSFNSMATEQLYTIE